MTYTEHYTKPDTQATSALDAHIAALHALALSYIGQGKLSVASFKDGAAPQVEHFATGDVPGHVAAIRRMGADPGRNVYAPLCVMRPDLPNGRKGAEADIAAVLGSVADFDDLDAGRWAERLPCPPDYCLETSAGRFQCGILFDHPLPVAEAKAIGRALRDAAGCDHGALDASHVWRLPGTVNWPTASKLAAGRPAVPQPVQVVKPWAGTVTAVDDLRRILHANAPAHAAATTTPEADGWNIGPLPEWDDRWTDDAALIAHLCDKPTGPREAFNGKPTYRDIWTNNANVLLGYWEKEGAPGEVDYSEVDCSLAGTLAFWTGHDHARVERLMWQSALVRDKWTTNAGYLRTTIKAGVKACRGEYARKPLPTVPGETTSRPFAPGDAWPDPEPLAARLDTEPYPIDALPVLMQAAVREVHGFVQAPLPMVACSALAAVSIAAMTHVDVERAAKLKGPTSLFLLTVADSGERKSTLDGFFTSTIRAWEEREAARLAPELRAHEAVLGAWAAKRDGLREAVKKASKDGKTTTEAEAKLRDLEQSRPVAPRVPKVLRGDDTPEALAHLLAKEWPAAAVASSEAGLVLGAHGMGRETIMRNLAQLNVLWDGGTLSTGRRTSESFTVRGARLTVALQVQEPTLRAFFDGSKGLARGTGFLARFLVCWPASTQGYRPFTEAPEHWPALAGFNGRIETLLSAPAPMAADGTLTPTVLHLAPDAKTAWVRFYNDVEGQLPAGGDLAEVRDVASKIADNAARIAALFHVLEHGAGGQVGAAHMGAACHVAAWHLTEARRFFGEIALPEPMADAVRVERWVLDHCRRNGGNTAPRRVVQNAGPVRDGKRLESALLELANAHRVRTVEDGRHKLLMVNPALVG